MFKKNYYGYNLLQSIQVVLLQIIYAEMRSTRSSDSRKWLNALVLFQYGPRVRQIYISWKELTKSKGKFVGWVKAAFIFFLYILSSHVSFLRYWFHIYQGWIIKLFGFIKIWFRKIAPPKVTIQSNKMLHQIGIFVEMIYLRIDLSKFIYKIFIVSIL